MGDIGSAIGSLGDEFRRAESANDVRTRIRREDENIMGLNYADLKFATDRFICSGRSSNVRKGSCCWFRGRMGVHFERKKSSGRVKETF